MGDKRRRREGRSGGRGGGEGGEEKEVRLIVLPPVELSFAMPSRIPPMTEVIQMYVHVVESPHQLLVKVIQHHSLGHQIISQ